MPARPEATGRAQSREEVVWRPQRGPQHCLFDASTPELFFGGSRGGGKTDGVLGKWAWKDHLYGEAFNAVMFRRTTVSSTDAIDRSKQIFAPLGGKFNESKLTWRMPNGGRVAFGYLDSVDDAAEYQGRNLTDAWIEEAGQYPSPDPIFRLFGALRSSGGVPVQMILTGNPGGPGQSWIRERYEMVPFPTRPRLLIKPLPDGSAHKVMVIPSRLSDNRILMRTDPQYASRLQLVGKAQLVRAWLDGDWNAIEGAFFDEWDEKRHVVPAFTVPAAWMRFRSMDWGSAAPFSVAWWAVASDDHVLPDGRTIPRGAIVRYREWYGSAGDDLGVGLKLTAEAVGKGIREREQNETIAYGALDPSAFAESGGPSIAEMMRRIDGNSGPRFRPADNTRVGKAGAHSGWMAVHARLAGDANGNPMLFASDACKALIRTLPMLQHDPDRPEDVDCWVAGTMVSTPEGERAIETLAPGDIVDTPIGPRRATASYCSGASETIRVELSNGLRLEGTPHHKIYVDGEGLIELSALRCHMILREKIIWPNALSIAVLCIRAMRVGVTTIRTGRFFQAAAQAFIAKFGLTGGMKSRLAGISTISTTTTTITSMRTSSACLQASTDGFIWPTVSLVRATLDGGLRSGAGLKLENPRCGTMRARCAKEPRSGSARALIVATLLKLDTLRDCIARPLAVAASLVASIASARFAGKASRSSKPKSTRRAPVHIVAVGRCAERTPVYNLSVDEAMLFYANGVLSSNTTMIDHAADDCRYACLSRPWTPAKPATPADKNPSGYSAVKKASARVSVATL